jgi:phosphoglycerate kinase
MNKKTVKDLPDDFIRGKRALLRCDFNVPLDPAGRVADDTRIRASLPTINYLAERGGRVVILSHLGRPKGKADKNSSLRPAATRLGELLGKRFLFFESTDNDAAVQRTRQLADGDVLVLENTRFLAGEEKNDDRVAQALAKLGDYYVNDAFGAAHRAHASTEGIARVLRPAVAGLLMESEVNHLGRALFEPQRPFVAILGGAKISGKIDVIESLLPRVDAMLIGGAMACTFFRALGHETGKSLVEEDRVELAGELLQKAGMRLIIPHDALVAPSLDDPDRARAVTRNQIPQGEAVYDIGPKTAESYTRAISTARTVFWNGPMSVAENAAFANGTLAIARAMADATDRLATTIVGGGDSVAAVTQLGLADRMTHVSTGGGASLEFLEGKPLPGVEVLDDRAQTPAWEKAGV